MKRVIAFAALLCLCHCLTGQSRVVSDAGMWTTFTIQKQLAKRWELAIDEEFRLRDNFQRINLFYSNLGLSYKFSKKFKVEVSYRSIQKMQLEQTISFRHRLQLDFTFKSKTDLFTFSNRLRYQSEVQNFYSSSKGKLPENFLRYKVEAKVDLGKFYTPYISLETRYQINSPKDGLVRYNMGFHRLRSIAGVELKVNEKNSMNIYYLVQNEFDIIEPENIYIFGLQYIFNF